MLHSVGIAEACGLGSFAGTRGAKEEKTGFHRCVGKGLWGQERMASLAHQALVALGDHVGLHLLGGVDRHADED